MITAGGPPVHVILFALGSQGDVSPLHLIARELRRREHEVTFVALPGFRTDPKDQFDIVTAPHDLAPELRPIAGGTSILSKTWFRRGFSSWRASVPLMMRRTRWMHEFVKARHVRNRTVVLARGGLFGARIAREILDIRLITVHHTPSSFRSRYESLLLPIPEGTHGALRAARDLLWRGMDCYVGSLLRPHLNIYRRHLNLPPIQRLFDKWVFSPDMNLGLFPEWFARPQPDWPTNTQLAGFPLIDENENGALSDEVHGFLSRGGPVIVFTRGSHAVSGAEFFLMSRALCRKKGLRGLLLGVAPGSHPQPRNPSMLQVDFAPLAGVLRRASVLVHHGGVGTCALAFRAGVPQIVIPGIGDQWEQAKRVARLGCGIYLPPRSLNEAKLASILVTIMENEGMRARCAKIAKNFHSDGISEAASLVELAGKRT